MSEKPNTVYPQPGDTIQMNMKQTKFSLTHKDDQLLELVMRTAKRTLAVWATECAGRVLPFFEETYPEDHRPRLAIDALNAWIETGVFSMQVVRSASLASHAAARGVGEDNAARSAARAAGQAAATAHVPTHSYGCAVYAQQAAFRAASTTEARDAAARERDWQYNRLLELK
jgi:hypothetical protein